MYYIIETPQQLGRLQTKTECFVEVIPMNYDYHPNISRVSLVYYNNFDKGYIISIDHSESFTQDIQSVVDFISTHERVWVWDSKRHSYYLPNNNLKDLYLCQLGREGNIKRPEVDTSYHTKMYREMGIKNNVNYFIPISKHYERCENLFSLSQFSNISSLDISSEYKWVEESGIGVTKSVLDIYKLQNPNVFISEGKAFTSYNLYNQTGRPTNSFGGINFLAIPKQEEIRKCFIPTNDYFVEFDFDAYHPRLVAKECGITLPNETFHNYLAKLYFNTDNPSPEQYQKSKELTFRQMYGGVIEEWKSIEFFDLMEKKTVEIWKEYEANRYYTLPTGIRIPYTAEITPSKLFNYWVQNLETYNNWKLLKKLKRALAGRATKLILITYDSFLFDFSVLDGKELLAEIKHILQSNNMIIKHKWAKDLNL